MILKKQLFFSSCISWSLLSETWIVSTDEVFLRNEIQINNIMVQKNVQLDWDKIEFPPYYILYHIFFFFFERKNKNEKTVIPVFWFCEKMNFTRIVNIFITFNSHI